MADDAPTTEPHEDIEAMMSDYHDGTLPEVERERVKAHLAGCEACRAAYAELGETLSALTEMRRKKEGAPAELADRVTETIHRRSAGRFFGAKTLGDRVPFGVLLILALIVLAATAGLLYSSTTGTLRTRPPATPPPIQGSGQVAPTP